MRPAHIFTIVILLETLFFIATRLVLRYYPWSSMEAELIRTVLRIGTALVYWRLYKTLILSRQPDLSVLVQPQLAIGILLLAMAVFLTGNYHLPTQLALLFALTSIPVAIKEEIVFRGIVQNLLTKKYGIVIGVILASAVFLVAHIGVIPTSLSSFSSIFIYGLLFGFIYIRSGSILVVIIVHAAYDAIWSFSPFISAPLDAKYSLIPLLGSLTFVLYWARSRPS